MKRISIVIAILALSGGAAWAITTIEDLRWEKKHSKPEQTKKDFDECSYDAEKALVGSKYRAIAKSMQRGRLLEQCMKVRGYAAVEPPKQ
jgi:hypothetical protein